MAQRSKKQTRKSPAAARPVAADSAATAAMSTSSGSPAASVSGGRSFTTEFNPDYSQTIKDLKRIALLAGTFFAILIALALILP